MGMAATEMGFSAAGGLPRKRQAWRVLSVEKDQNLQGPAMGAGKKLLLTLEAEQIVDSRSTCGCFVSQTLAAASILGRSQAFPQGNEADVCVGPSGIMPVIQARGWDCPSHLWVQLCQCCVTGAKHTSASVSPTRSGAHSLAQELLI